MAFQVPPTDQVSTSDPTKKFGNKIDSAKGLWNPPIGLLTPTLWKGNEDLIIISCEHSRWGRLWSRKSRLSSKQLLVVRWTPHFLNIPATYRQQPAYRFSRGRATYTLGQKFSKVSFKVQFRGIAVVWLWGGLWEELFHIIMCTQNNVMSSKRLVPENCNFLARIMPFPRQVWWKLSF